MGREGWQAVAGVAALATFLFVNSGCKLTTFGNITTTSTSTGDGTSDGGSSGSRPHLQGDPFNVTDGTRAASSPVVVYASQNTAERAYVAFWEDGSVSSGLSNVITGKPVRFDSNGTRLETVGVQVSSSNRLVRNPAAAAREGDKNELFVVWEETPFPSTGPRSIMGRRVRREGNNLNLITDALPVTITAGISEDCVLPAIAGNRDINGTGTKYLVVFAKPIDSGATAYRLFARVVNSDGAPQGTAKQLDANSAVPEFDRRARPAVAYSSSLDQWQVVWNAGPPTNSRVFRVGVQFIANEIVATLQTGGLSPSSSSEPIAPHIAFNTQRLQYLTVWRENATGVNRKIVRQSLSETGASTGNLTTVTDQRFQADLPRVSYATGIDRFLVTWQDARTSNSSLDILGHLFHHDGSGIPVSSDQDFFVASGAAEQDLATAAYDPASQTWLALWRESSQIRGQRVRLAF
ncbi:MAG: hypothetical protein HY816_04730 [Candidatus Wallbacteria bacterium]|nr:hypothetical protein [Candidatus Wallbacteria bacterium]